MNWILPASILPSPPNSPVSFKQLAVNIEENSSREPIPYRTPPGVVRQQQLSNNNVNILLNEQSLSLQCVHLPNKETTRCVQDHES